MNSVVLVHYTRCNDTRFNDAQSNDARFIHRLCKYAYFIEIIQNITGMKNIGVIGKNLVSWVRETSLAKQVAILTNCRFFKFFFRNLSSEELCKEIVSTDCVSYTIESK